MTMPHRTWFPFILIGLSLGLLLVVALLVKEKNEAPIPPEDYVLPAEAYDYPGSVANVFLGFQSSENAVGAREQLLLMRVPSEYRDLHVALVLYFDAAIRGEVLEAEGQYATLKTQYPWLP